MKKIFFAIIALGAMTIGISSCVEDEVYEGPATISSVSYSPTTVTPDDNVTVTATITDLQGINSAVIKYKIIGNAEQSADMTASGNTYTGTIPKAADKAKIEFFIEAVNKAGITAKSAVISYEVGAIPIPYENLVLNELNGNDKFIEIFNKGTEAIPLKDVYIEKDGNNVWTGSETQTLAGGAYLLLYSEDVKTDHATHPADQFFTSGLSAKKAVRVQLFSPTASLDDFNLVDYEKAAPASYSRWANGTGTWMFAAATPGAVNVAGSEAVNGLH
ncbi:lamin tail domain-containing protein [Bacteroidales bacterium OttesenSCG-928-A17]|nr:lamin tail domain-containing protein [Bacteroidales bacterium OttesenSCG-928-A17]